MSDDPTVFVTQAKKRLAAAQSSHQNAAIKVAQAEALIVQGRARLVELGFNTDRPQVGLAKLEKALESALDEIERDLRTVQDALV